MTDDFIEVGQTNSGHKIYREPNGSGGFRYWSDSIDGGAMIWDTCLLPEEDLRTVMQLEQNRRLDEYLQQRICNAKYLCPDCGMPDSSHTGDCPSDTDCT